MPLDLLRRLGFDGAVTGFIREPPEVLTPPGLVTGLHLQFDSAFLRRVSERVSAGLLVPPDRLDHRPSAVAELTPTNREERRRAVQYALENFGTGKDREFERLFDWSERCREMGYPEHAKPVVIIVDYGEKADRRWLERLPSAYDVFPIRYRFSPPAQAQVGNGSVISGADVGTLGGILEDSAANELYAMTCAHVAGATSATVSEIDKKGNVSPIGQIVASTVPQTATGACNAHARPGAGLDAALIRLSSAQSATLTKGLTVGPIIDVDQDDLVSFVGGKSGNVGARVAAATIWKEIYVGGQLRCFGDLFALGHRQVNYVLQAVSQGGDSGTWIFEDSSPNSANTRWLGMLIAGEKQQNQSLACYSEHLFRWAKRLVPNIVLGP